MYSIKTLGKFYGWTESKPEARNFGSTPPHSEKLGETKSNSRLERKGLKRLNARKKQKRITQYWTVFHLGALTFNDLVESLLVDFFLKRIPQFRDVAKSAMAGFAELTWSLARC